MEFEGTVYKVLAPVSGTSTRGEWTKQEVVFELAGEYARKVCVTFWGDKAQEGASLKEGEVVNVSINIESKEYNNRWFTEIRAWRITKKNPEPAPSAAGGDNLPAFSVPDAEPFNEAPCDDLPF